MAMGHNSGGIVYSLLFMAAFIGLVSAMYTAVFMDFLDNPL